MVKTVVVTGGAGRIAYALIPLLCDGSIFGDSIINLRLLDIEMAAAKLNGIKMEIEDCCYDRIASVTTSIDPNIAFMNANVVIILGGFPRSPGMERKDLIAKNAEGMKVQAEALNKHASTDCRVLVIANPCNTNCLVMRKIATNIPPENFSCLTRLDQERLSSFVLHAINNSLHLNDNNGKRHLSLSKPLVSSDIRNTIIWGNHSNTQVPDVTNIEVNLPFLDDKRAVIYKWTAIVDVFDKEWLMNDLICDVQKRGAEIIGAQGASSGLSAANAIAKHLKDWFALGDGRKRGLSDIGMGHPSEKPIFSMGVSSDNNPYGIPSGLIFSFPCCFNEHSNDIQIVPNFPVSAEMRQMMDATVQELLMERADAESIVGTMH